MFDSPLPQRSELPRGESDSAVTALGRLRSAFHGWEDSGPPDQECIGRFQGQINDDLNPPRALAVSWDLVRSRLPEAVKKATLLGFDQVLGLDLAQWLPATEAIPEAIADLVTAREQARREKRWQDADALRGQIIAAGYTVEDTPAGSRVQRDRR